MNTTPQAPKPKSAAPLLALLLGVTALAAGFSVLLTTQPAGLSPKPLLDLSEARGKAEQVQRSAQPAAVEAPAPKTAEAALPPVAPIPAKARTIDPDEGTRRARFEPAEVLREVHPTYPAAARAARIQGPVEVLVKVDDRGRPSQASVISGPGLLRQEALEAAQAWRFMPARSHGRPVSSPYTIRFNFRIA